MKREFRRFFTRKYILIIIPILLLILIPTSTQYFSSDLGYGKNDVYSDFISGLEPYETQEELQELIDSCNSYKPSMLPGLNTIDNSEKINFYKMLYGIALQENLPYDSFVMMDNFKYTHFHYFAYYCIYMCMFIVLASIIIASFYQTSDFISKTAKLVYTSGEKRTKIIARKYFVSLISISSIVLLFDVIFSLLGLRYAFTGAKYFIIYADKSVYAFTYAQYVCLNIVSHLLMLAVIYTFVYYLAALLKNGIITSCAFLAVALLLLFFNQYGESSAQAIFLTMFTQGVGAAFTLGNGDTLNYIALYIPFVVAAIAMAVTSNLLLRKSDYSR